MVVQRVLAWRFADAGEAWRSMGRGGGLGAVPVAASETRLALRSLGSQARAWRRETATPGS